MSGRRRGSAARSGSSVLLGGLLLVACSTGVSSGVDPGHGLTQTATTALLPPVVGPLGCSPASPSHPYGSISTEIHGSANGKNRFWARVAGRPPFAAGTQIRILFAVTGNGRAHVVAEGPAGSQIEPDSLFLSQSSSWTRPGDDWSAVITFPTAGCWRINVVHGGAHGDIWVHLTS